MAGYKCMHDFSPFVNGNSPPGLMLASIIGGGNHFFSLIFRNVMILHACQAEYGDFGISANRKV